MICGSHKSALILRIKIFFQVTSLVLLTASKVSDNPGQ